MINNLQSFSGEIRWENTGKKLYMSFRSISTVTEPDCGYLWWLVKTFATSFKSQGSLIMLRFDTIYINSLNFLLYQWSSLWIIWDCSHSILWFSAHAFLAKTNFMPFDEDLYWSSSFTFIKVITLAEHAIETGLWSGTEFCLCLCYNSTYWVKTKLRWVAALFF